jgi:hypothetical protein
MIDGNNPADAGTADAQPVSQPDDIETQIGDAFLASAEEHAEEAPPPQPESETPQESTAEDGQEEAPAESEDEPAETKDEQPPTRIKLKTGEEVTLDELSNGYLRQSDYTRKTQEIAAQRNEIQSAEQRLTQADQVLRQNLNLAQQVIEAFRPQQPSAALLDSDPHAYMRAQRAFEEADRAYRAVLDGQQSIAQRQQQLTQQQEQRQLQERQKTLAQERQALLEKAPEFRDAAKFEAFQKDAATLSEKHYGLTADEISEITDHRAVMVLRDALAYRKLQSEKMRAVAQAKTAPPMRPAARPAVGTQARQAAQSAMDRLRREGTVEAAAAAFPDDLIN